MCRWTTEEKILKITLEMRKQAHKMKLENAGIQKGIN